MPSVTETAAESGTRTHPRTLLGVAAVVVAFDQLTKAWALSALDDRLIDLFWTLRLRLTFNEGSAFGLGGDRTTVVSIIALVVSAVVLRAGLRATERTWAVGLGLVLGGALGNLVDRAVREGEGFLGGRVVDFIDLQWWPVFNLADVAIVLGVAWLVVLSFRSDDR